MGVEAVARVVKAKISWRPTGRVYTKKCRLPLKQLAEIARGTPRSHLQSTCQGAHR
jgi:hypothetical protein